MISQAGNLDDMKEGAENSGAFAGLGKSGLPSYHQFPKSFSNGSFLHKIDLDPSPSAMLVNQLCYSSKPMILLHWSFSTTFL